MKKFITSILLIIVVFNVQSQSFFSELLQFNSGGMLSLQWNIGQPTGSMKDFTSKTSIAGINLDFKHCYRNGIILGGRAGWQNFNEDIGLSNVKTRTSATYTKEINKINVVPILVTADYLFNSNIILPYAGMGLGVFYVSQSTEINNVKTYSEKSFNFGISPEIGVTIPFIVSYAGMNINTKYNYAFGAGSSSGMGWFEFNVGISIMY